VHGGSAADAEMVQIRELTGGGLVHLRRNRVHQACTPGAHDAACGAGRDDLAVAEDQGQPLPDPGGSPSLWRKASQAEVALGVGPADARIAKSKNLVTGDWDRQDRQLTR
jgi:hypothetical protein